MSIWQELVQRFWPRKTLRVAYLRWQAEEDRLITARQRLARQYLITRGVAERLQFAANLGVLRTARTLLDQPLDPPVLLVKERLHKGFAYLGTAYCRRLPPPLDMELDYYLSKIDQLGRSHGELEVRLRLAQEILAIFERTPEFCQRRFFHLALVAPESAWLLCRLRTKRHQNRQAFQNCLAENCQIQIQ
jgi:hypothetical protein